MIYLYCLFYSSWAFAKADLKVFLKEVRDKALFASAVAIRFKVFAAHLLCEIFDAVVFCNKFKQ